MIKSFLIHRLEYGCTFHYNVSLFRPTHQPHTPPIHPHIPFINDFLIFAFYINNSPSFSKRMYYSKSKVQNVSSMLHLVSNNTFMKKCNVSNCNQICTLVHMEIYSYH